MNIEEMRTSRRSFVKKGLTSAAFSLLLPSTLLAAIKKSEVVVAVQLYSFWKGMFQDPLKTLQEIAAIGFTHIEHSGYAEGAFYGFPPVEFKEILDDLGLKMLSGESLLIESYWDRSSNQFSDSWKQLLDDSAVVGQKWVFSPWLEEHLDSKVSDLNPYLDMFNACGELCKEMGLQFGYSNDAFEFRTKIEGEILYFLIMDQLDPALVAHQLNIGKIYESGYDPLILLPNYPNRFNSLRVKDMRRRASDDSDFSYESTTIGSGHIPVKKILKKFRKSQNTQYFVIEQNDFQGMRETNCMQQNFENMKKWGYY